MYILKKSTRLHYVAMMMRDYRLMIELRHILTGQVLVKYVKQSY